MARKLQTGVKRWSKILAATTAAAGAVIGSRTSSAGVFIWTGDVNNQWNQTGGSPVNTNWSSSSDFNSDPGTLPGATDDVFFNFSPAPNLSNLNSVLGTDFSIKSLTFTADSVVPVTIGGANTLTLGAGGINDINGAAPHTISANVVLGAAQTWTNNALNPLLVSGIISARWWSVRGRSLLSEVSSDG